MSWTIRTHPEVKAWLDDLAKTDPRTAARVQVAVRTLAQVGPTLTRPLADRVEGSRHHNMKELRPVSTGQMAVRMLFAFDPQRRAILLVAGNKAGRWTSWYRENIPLADARYDEHLATLSGKERGR